MKHIFLIVSINNNETAIFQRQVTGSLIAQQSGDLAHEVTELLGAGLLVAQNAQFVLQQRMLNDHRGHNTRSLYCK